MPPLNSQADISRRARAALNLGLSLHLHPYFVYASSQDPGESAHLRQLAQAFVAQQCDNYLYLICWLENYFKTA